MAKAPATVYVCQSCGNQSRKWLGKCPDCGEWNSFVEERARAAAPSKGLAARSGLRLREVRPIRYGEIESQDDARVSSGVGEFDRVLGGGIVPGSLVLIGGDPGIGKCLAGSSRILDPSTGAFLPITDWARERRPVLTLGSDFRLAPQPTTAFHDQGVRPVIEVKTRLGRALRCTHSHPVLTPDGWRAVGDLPPGTRVAAPRSLPYFGTDAMPEHQLKLIAYILSDGSAQSSINVTTAIPGVESDLASLAARLSLSLSVYPKPRGRAKMYRFVQPNGQRASARSVVAASIKKAHAGAGMTWAEWSRAAGVSYGMLNAWRRGGCVPSEAELRRLADAAGVSLAALSPNERDRAEMTTAAARFVESVGLRFTTAKTKSVPDCVFRLPRKQLALFLKVLFSCDGSVYVNAEGQPGVSYSTISERLAQDVQHLLLRFGFVARLRTKRSRVNSRPYVAYELQLLGIAEVKRFLSEIDIWGREEAKSRVEALPIPRRPATQRDTIPTGAHFWAHLREAAHGASFSEISAKAGVKICNRRHERPLCRSTVAAVAEAYPSPYLNALVESDIYWDEIQSITPAGEERVYDLSVDSHANFVSNDLIVHNSTLLLQVADRLSGAGARVLYVSGEESERQIKMRGERLGVAAENLYLLPETNLDQILEEVERAEPAAVIVDSIQTVFSPRIESAPGSVSQVREVAAQFLLLAKNRTVPVFLIGHVTKEGSIAGPKALEHIVDTVLYFEGERHHNHRIVRAAKNRFGAANELGVFEMTGEGLVPVANPSEMFLQERPQGVAGSVVTACMEGTRPLLVEVQALVAGSKYGTGRRMAQGLDANRVALLIAMLEKRAGFHLLGDDVFVNVAGGLEVDEPAADLGVVTAIASSFKNKPVDPHTAVFGEVGLTGEVRGALQAQARAREAQALGFKRVVMPASNTAGLERLLGIRAVGVRSVEEALDELF
ncbi:MAG TPA: DNA repair protein RadA [Pyrinomonadaceae bacterium]|nr:DNA repair protein RadA [Pyrinomonadaceae bacterium]